MIKELIRGLKWVVLAIGVVAVLVVLWLACAWSVGYGLNHFFDLRNFGPKNFVSLGSCALVFTLIIQIITVILVGWFLLAYGKAHGFAGLKRKTSTIMEERSSDESNHSIVE